MEHIEYTQSVELAKVLLVLGLVVFCCITDIGVRRIPNAMLLPVLIAGLSLNTLGGGFGGFADSFAGLLAGLAMLLPLHVFGRMGAGDVKLLGVVGSILGGWGAIVAGLATMLAGGILGVAYIAWLALEPSVKSLTWQIATIFRSAGRPAGTGPATDATRATEIPYAVAIAAGSVAALAYTGLFPEVFIL